MDTEILIPPNEPVRLLKAVMEEMDYTKLMAAYSELGRMEYPPRILFKVMLYADMQKIRSTRKIEQACREHINFMYLLEGERAPDHNTISWFRRYCLPKAIEDLMQQLVKRFIEIGEISLADGAVFIDGTKIEANANRYTFVWKKATVKNREKLNEKIQKDLPRMLEKIGVKCYISM